MTHYLENFTELLPAKPNKDLVIADYLNRAKAAGFESFIIADGRRTQRSIEEKVDYVMNTRLDVRYKDAMSEAGFTEDELKLITDEYDEIDPALIARGRAVIVEQEAIDCAEFHFEEKQSAHQKELRENSGKDEVIKLVGHLASKPPALAGPATSHAVDELISELHASAPWLRDVSGWVYQAMRSEYAAGKTWLNLPPILLVGPPGLGKSTYARKLASLAGTPIRVVDAGASAASFAVAGADSTWSSSQAGIPLQEIAKTGIANPVIVVDEIDKAGRMQSSSGRNASLSDALLGLLEPSSSIAWECPFTRRSFDMSNVSWILTANDIDNVPEPLIDRCRVFNVEQPGPEDLAQMIRAQCRGRVFDEVANELITRMLKSSRSVSLRRVQEMIDEAAAVMNTPVLH